MLNNVSTNVERIIAKIDNDFNPDNSDWIPRVGTWVIDAMGQCDALRTVRNKVKLIVKENIAYSTCPIDSPNLIVYDKTGCEISKHKSGSGCDCDSSTGEQPLTPATITIDCNEDTTNGPDMLASQINDNSLPMRYNYKYKEVIKKRDYTLIGDNKLELSFKTDFIYVETDIVETTFSDTYNCEMPNIPNVEELIEAVAYYCVYKMLLRGYKHPVLNLAASQYGTNPYYEWNKLKPIAKRAVIIAAQGNINKTDGNAFQAAFFITSYK